MRLHQRRYTTLFALSLLCCLTSLSRSAPAKPAVIPLGPTAQEIKLGNEAVAEIAKDPKIKMLDLSIPANKALSDKLNAMATTLGKVSLRPLIKYSVQIIDDKDVNAFTVPNGHIYVYRGLTEIAGSDDELASVIAHEIGHNAMMHALREQKKEKPLNWIGIAALLAAFAGENGANIAQMAPYVLTGVMNGYSVEYEKEADHCAIDEMAQTQYNPSALVTFMNRMSDQEARSPEIHLGIFETHPPSPERAAAAIEQLKEKGIPYTPRAVTGGVQAEILANSPDRSTIRWGKIDLVSLVAATDDTVSIKIRAERVAATVNQLMRDNLHLYELVVTGNDKGATLTARGIEIASVSPTAAAAQNMTPLAVAQKWKANFGRLFWNETMKGDL